MRDQPAHGNCALPARGELGRVAHHWRIEVERAAFGEAERAQRGHAIVVE
jgi:hypothetical protein